MGGCDVRDGCAGWWQKKYRQVHAPLCTPPKLSYRVSYVNVGLIWEVAHGRVEVDDITWR